MSWVPATMRELISIVLPEGRSSNFPSAGTPKKIPRDLEVRQWPLGHVPRFRFGPSSNPPLRLV